MGKIFWNVKLKMEIRFSNWYFIVRLIFITILILIVIAKKQIFIIKSSISEHAKHVKHKSTKF